ncbi:hypothetical protein K7X08_001523 [Anisodus acutangulus]|uniref:Uncharacterized protein n=1 Tax=Anisodus acutangulus TaxID=402998 RepID=A0A9Q1MS69_9SOLA|nr:hypothetical protein K7X08_001523 [Anisodus acutangulus]
MWPLLYIHYGFQYKNKVEAAVASVKNIGIGTVKRLIYTGTVLAASPLKDDGNGFKDLMDEACWTPLNVHFPYGCDLVGGATLLSYVSASMANMLSLVTGDEIYYKQIKFLEETIGKVPIVHIDDSYEGRFLCASSFLSTAETASYYQEKYPEFHINQKYLDDPKREVKWGSNKLMEKGFVYKYDMKKLLDESISSARKLGVLKLPSSG